MQQTT
jgi:putative SOS response-associated peptidase YedK